MSKWTAIEIKGLRLRLGWSAADFSRRFGCLSDVILNWEKGVQTPSSDDERQLDRLAFYLESYCEMVLREPIAEQVLKAEGLDQIHLDHLLLRRGDH